MSIASWFSVPRFHRASALDKPARRPRPQPTRSRPTLEALEERALLNATGLVGGDNNLMLNGASASTGNILPIQTDGSHAVLDNPRGDAAASSDLLAQNQPYSQFRLFGINSQGDSARFAQHSTASILRDAFGFGSGTMPNAPWMPKVYSVGLANNQYGYPSQTDMGFTTVPPWARHTAQSLPKKQDLDQDNPVEKPEKTVEKNEEAVEKAEQVAAKRALLEQEQPTPDTKDRDSEDPRKDVEPRMEQPASEKQSPLESVQREDGSLPDSLLLSALAPVPMAALVTGLPGTAAAEDSGDAGSDAAE